MTSIKNDAHVSTNTVRVALVETPQKKRTKRIQLCIFFIKKQKQKKTPKTSHRRTNRLYGVWNGDVNHPGTTTKGTMPHRGPVRCFVWDERLVEVE